MKATKIIYKRLFNLGNYSHEEIGIEIEIEKGEKADDVLKRAKQFILAQDPKNENERKYNEALSIVKYKQNHSWQDVVDAEKSIEEYESGKNIVDELPF